MKMPSEEEMEALARASQALANRIKPLLAGQDPGAQGAALGELLALWLAGHYQYGQDCIERLLEQHVELVRRLYPTVARRLQRETEGRKQGSAH